MIIILEIMDRPGYPFILGGIVKYGIPGNAAGKYMVNVICDRNFFSYGTHDKPTLCSTSGVEQVKGKNVALAIWSVL